MGKMKMKNLKILNKFKKEILSLSEDRVLQGWILNVLLGPFS